MTSGHRDTGTPGHRDTGTPLYSHTPPDCYVTNKRVVGTPGHRDTGTPGYSHTPPDCYVTTKRVVGTSWHRDTGTPGHRDIHTHHPIVSRARDRQRSQHHLQLLMETDHISRLLARDPLMCYYEVVAKDTLPEVVSTCNTPSSRTLWTNIARSGRPTIIFSRALYLPCVVNTPSLS